MFFCKTISSETDTTPAVSSEQLSREMHKASQSWALLTHGGVSTTTSVKWQSLCCSVETNDCKCFSSLQTPTVYVLDEPYTCKFSWFFL